MSDQPTLMLDFASEPNERTRGEIYIERGDKMFCPKCLEEINGYPCYGLAYGGIGTYWECYADGCDWFYKVLDSEE